MNDKMIALYIMSLLLNVTFKSIFEFYQESWKQSSTFGLFPVELLYIESLSIKY